MEDDVCLPTTPGCTFLPALIWSCALEPSWVCILSGLENIIRTPGCDTFNLIREQFPLQIHLPSHSVSPRVHPHALQGDQTGGMENWCVCASPLRGSSAGARSSAAFLRFCITCEGFVFKPDSCTSFKIRPKKRPSDWSGWTVSQCQKASSSGKDRLSCAAARLLPQNKALAPQRVKLHRKRATLHERGAIRLNSSWQGPWIMCISDKTTEKLVKKVPQPINWHIHWSQGCNIEYIHSGRHTFSPKLRLLPSSYQLLHKISKYVIW